VFGGHAPDETLGVVDKFVKDSFYLVYVVDVRFACEFRHKHRNDTLNVETVETTFLENTKSTFNLP